VHVCVCVHVYVCVCLFVCVWCVCARACVCVRLKSAGHYGATLCCGMVHPFGWVCSESCAVLCFVILC